VNEDLRATPCTEPYNNIDQYARWTESFWFSGIGRPDKESLAIMGLGLAGEAGETVEHIKKYIRDGNLDPIALKKELGDVIYYWARICKQFGFEPTDVLRTNYEKLVDRQKRGVRQGSGDNR
jgi:NTP pyrophosphatase (non-canonical NTP hydrolase)